jgi:hypothetical protein
MSLSHSDVNTFVFKVTASKSFVFTRKSKEEEYRFQKIRMHNSSVHEGNSFFPRIQGNVKLFL